MGNALFFQHPGQQLGFLDGNGAHQHRLAFFVTFLDLPDGGPELAGLGLIDHVRIVRPDHRLVGRDLHHVQGIDPVEFLLLGHGGTGHAGELLIEAEEVLEGDGGKSLALAGHLHAFLCLDGLMQALVIAAAVHQAARCLVNDDDLAVLHHVVHVPLHDAPGLHGLVDMMGKGGVFNVRQILYVEVLLRLLDAGCGQLDGTVLFIHVVVAVVVIMGLLVVGGGVDLFLQTGHKEIRHLIELGALVSPAGNNQRGSGFVDQNGVHLVHNGKAVASLHLILFIQGHIVPQIIEAQLVVGAVCNIGGVGLPPVIRGHIVNNQTHAQPHKPVDLAHPLRVTLGQIVVDGDDVDALALEGVQIGRQNCNQGFAFAGLHLRDTALVQDDAADQLDPIGPHPQHTPGGLPNRREGLRENVVQGFAPGKPRLEGLGLPSQLLVGERLIGLVQGLDLIYNGSQLLDLPLGGAAK